MGKTTDDRLEKIESDVAEMKELLKIEMKELLKMMYPLLVASNARGEEQSKRIDDLNRMVASLIPQQDRRCGMRRQPLGSS